VRRALRGSLEPSVRSVQRAFERRIFEIKRVYLCLRAVTLVKQRIKNNSTLIFTSAIVVSEWLDFLFREQVNLT
jgi:hypothetical protein